MIKALVSYTLSYDDSPQWEKIMDTTKEELETNFTKYKDPKLPGRYYVEDETGYYYIRILSEISLEQLRQKCL